MSGRNDVGQVLRWNSLNRHVEGVVERDGEGLLIVRLDNGHTMRLEDLAMSKDLQVT